MALGSFFLAPTANFKQTTLNGVIDSSVTTITLNSTANMTAPGYIVIDRVDSNNNSTPNSREVVSYTGIAGSDLTGCTRGADNSTQRSHSDGAIVEVCPTIGMWNNLATITSTAINSDGYLKAINSPVSIARLESAQAVFASIATIAALEIRSLAVASIASIARLESPLHAGAKGHFLWLQSGVLVTSLATATNNSQIPFLRATKNLTLNSVYLGVNSAPSLGPLQMNIYYKSTPTGVTGTSIFSVKPLVGIGLNENLAGATVGTLGLTSLASGVLLYPEVNQPNGAGDLTVQLIATER